MNLSTGSGKLTDTNFAWRLQRSKYMSTAYLIMFTAIIMMGKARPPKSIKKTIPVTQILSPTPVSLFVTIFYLTVSVNLQTYTRVFRIKYQPVIVDLLVSCLLSLTNDSIRCSICKHMVTLTSLNTLPNLKCIVAIM